MARWKRPWRSVVLRLLLSLHLLGQALLQSRNPRRRAKQDRAGKRSEFPNRYSRTAGSTQDGGGKWVALPHGQPGQLLRSGSTWTGRSTRANTSARCARTLHVAFPVNSRRRRKRHEAPRKRRLRPCWGGSLAALRVFRGCPQLALSLRLGSNDVRPDERRRCGCVRAGRELAPRRRPEELRPHRPRVLELSHRRKRFQVRAERDAVALVALDPFHDGLLDAPL